MEVQGKITAIVGSAAGVCALIAAVWAGLVVADDRYVQASDFAQYAVEDFYDKYYAAEDRAVAAERRGDHATARQARRTMERLKAKICAIDSTWERCNG